MIAKIFPCQRMVVGVIRVETVRHFVFLDSLLVLSSGVV